MAVAAAGPVMGLDETSLQYAGVDIDDASLEISSDTLQVKADGVKDSHIDWGTGGSQVSAVDVPIADSGAIITATEVEGALQENRVAIDAIENNSITSPNGSVSVAGTVGADDQTVDVVFSKVGTANRAIDAADLASTSASEGASMIGINDTGSIITATTVEAALQENRGLIDTLATGLNYREPVWGGPDLQGFNSTNDYLGMQICLLLTAQPATGDVIVLNGTNLIAGTQFAIGGSLAVTITNLTAAIDGVSEFTAVESLITNIEGTDNVILIAHDGKATLPTDTYVTAYGVAGSGNNWAGGQPQYVEAAKEDASGLTNCANSGTTTNFQTGEAGVDGYFYSVRYDGKGVIYDATADEYVITIAPGAGTGDITAVNVTAPITGGGTSGDVTVGFDEGYDFTFDGTTVTFNGTTVDIDPTTAGFSGATVNFDGTTVNIDPTTVGFSGTTVNFDGTNLNLDATTTGLSGGTVNFDGTTVNVADNTIWNFNEASAAPFTVDSSVVVTNLNADQVDGIEAASFLRSDASDSITGSSTLTVTSGSEIEFASGSTLDVNGAAALDGATSLSLPTTSITGAGTGSGLDADQVDGLEATSFLRSDASDATAGTGVVTTITAGDDLDINGDLLAGGATSVVLPTTNISGAGTGSGLDADTVDGIEGASLIRSDASDSITGNSTLTVTSGSEIDIASGADLDINGDLLAADATSVVLPTSGITGAGTGSGLDADKLDSQEGTYYLDIANFTVASEAQGDVLFYDGAKWDRLAPGTSGEFLKTLGAAANPVWGTPDTSQAVIIADDTEVAGAGNIAIRRLVYYDPSTGKYLQADGTDADKSHVAGAATAAAVADAALNVAYAGRQALELFGTHAAITRGDYLYLYQGAGGYVIGKADIAFTNNYVILPVAIALASVSINTGGSIMAILGAVGLAKFVN